MEKYIINKNMKVFCVTAKSFPDGILSAHQQLYAMLPATEGRNFFVISYPDKNGLIIYKAAVEESYPGAQKLGCETFTIKKGEYLSEPLTDWRKDETIVARTFKQLISDPRIDKNGFCLEVYLNGNDMKCMVKTIAIE